MRRLFTLMAMLVACEPPQTTRIAVAPAPGGSAPPAQPTQPVGRKGTHKAPLTSTVAGFAFGLTAADIRNACRQAGAEFSDNERKVVCSASPVSLGFTAGVVVDFCDDGLSCEISVVPETNLGTLQRQINDLREMLNEKYGSPDDTYDTKDVGEFMRLCTSQHDAHLRESWIWSIDSGSPGRLQLAAFCEPGSSGVVLIYQDAAGLARWVQHAQEQRDNF